MMSWHSARLLYETEVEGPPDPLPLREESIRVFVADSETAAWVRAEAVGRENAHSYRNGAGELVSWKFLRVIEVQDLCEERLDDGVEVYSRLFRKRRGAAKPRSGKKR